MMEEINESSRVYNHYLELSKPTAEDFKRVFTDGELKELCLKHKCRVDIWRWNVVNDYRILFTESGRYQRWSARRRMLMLTKAVNKMKPSVLYNEEEIRRTRTEEWGLQLKENILSLNYWRCKQLQKSQLNRGSPQLYVSESEDIDQEVQLQCEVHTESMNAADLLTQPTQSQGQQSTQENLQMFEVNTESMNADELLTQSQGQQPPPETAQTNKENRNTPISSSETDDGNVLLDSWDADYLIEEDTNDSTETVLAKRPQQTGIVQVSITKLETLQSEEVAPEIEDIYGVNTLSMTIDSDMSEARNTPIRQSQDVIPQNYDNFKNIIPLTSTQSQSNESEEIEVT